MQDDSLRQVEEALSSYYALKLPPNKVREYCQNIESSLENFPRVVEHALLIKLIHDYEHSKNKKISVNTEVCRVQSGTCMTTFGVLSPDWPGLANACSGVINEMGWTIHFIKAFSIAWKRQLLGIVLIGVQTDKDDSSTLLLNQSNTILKKLHDVAEGTSAKAYLITEEIRKISMYSQVIAEIQRQYKGPDLDRIIGLDGEAVKFFAARSRDYIENRDNKDIARQIILNYNFLKNSRENSQNIQLDIQNFETMAEGTFTGVTVAGASHLLILEDCLKTIELTCPNYRLKHNREFTTKEGISVYRIEFVTHDNMGLSDLEQTRLRRSFDTMVLNKKRNRAQWIESIGGFEQYARAIIPLLVREARHTGHTQVYHSVGHTTDIYIDFKVIVVVPQAENIKKNLSVEMAKNIDNVNGIHLLSVKPPKLYGNIQVFIVDLRASLAIIDDVESIYHIIREEIRKIVGTFRDFDEGMRTMDATKLKSVKRILEDVDWQLLRELYYSIEDFFRISATNEEIVDHIRTGLEMLHTIEASSSTLLVNHKQTGVHAKSGKLMARASLIAIAYPHQMSLLQRILEVLDPYEVTLSRFERRGRDILICRCTKKDKALSEDQLEKVEKKIFKIPHKRIPRVR